MYLNGIKNTCGLCLFVLLASCGGGGGDGEGNGAPGIDGENVISDDPAEQNDLALANGGLEGFVWLERNSTMFNVDTGVSTFVGNSDGAWPRVDGQEFITVSENVRFVEDPSCRDWHTHLDRVTIHNTASGMAVGGFDIVESLFGVPRLSPDGLTIAGHWFDDSVCFSNDVALTVWDRTGRQIVNAVPGV